MDREFGFIRYLCLALALAGSTLTTACAHHYRAYDSYYNDYHVWNDKEVVYYEQWCKETHRDPHRDFRALPPDDQQEYWKWRHTRDEHHHH